MSDCYFSYKEMNWCVYIPADGGANLYLPLLVLR